MFLFWFQVFTLLILQYVLELVNYLRFGLWWLALGVASSIGLGKWIVLCFLICGFFMILARWFIGIIITIHTFELRFISNSVVHCLSCTHSLVDLKHMERNVLAKVYWLLKCCMGIVNQDKIWHFEYSYLERKLRLAKTNACQLEMIMNLMHAW